MNLYATIAGLEDLEQDKKEELFVYFAKNPGVKAEAVVALPECKDDGARVRFLRGLFSEPAASAGNNFVTRRWGVE
jgi:hypothetical protein